MKVTPPPAEIPLSYPDSYPVEMRPARVPPPPPPTPVGAPDPGQPTDPQWHLPPNEVTMAPSVPRALALGPQPGTTYLDTEQRLRQKWRAEGASEDTIEEALRVSRSKLLAGAGAA